MEIPSKFILNMGEVEINRDTRTNRPDPMVPVIGRKHGKVYEPERFLTGGDEEYFLRELTGDEDFRQLVGPLVDFDHLRRTGELKGKEYPVGENHVNFWLETHIVERGKNG